MLAQPKALSGLIIIIIITGSLEYFSHFPTNEPTKLTSKINKQTNYKRDDKGMSQCAQGAASCYKAMGSFKSDAWRFFMSAKT